MASIEPVCIRQMLMRNFTPGSIDCSNPNTLLTNVNIYWNNPYDPILVSTFSKISPKLLTLKYSLFFQLLNDYSAYPICIFHPPDIKYELWILVKLLLLEQWLLWEEDAAGLPASPLHAQHPLSQKQNCASTDENSCMSCFCMHSSHYDTSSNVLVAQRNAVGLAQPWTL